MERAEAEVEMAAGDEVHTPHSAPSTAPSARVSIWESVRACGVWGKEVDKAELRRQVVMPLYARRAVAAAVAAKDEAAGVAAAAAARGEQVEGEQEQGEGLAVVTPMVVFVNSKSGGRHGPELKLRLHELISKEQVMTSLIPPPARAALLPNFDVFLPRFASVLVVTVLVTRSGLSLRFRSNSAANLGFGDLI
jgi:diacylglycerol kinase (ATP)